MGILWATLLFAVLPLGAPAQEEQPPRTIVVQNLAPFPREEWVAATVPFPEGRIAGLPDLHVDGHATVWQPFGARWPDGSLRQAVCLFRPTLGALGERRMPLVEGSGPTPAVEGFALAPHTIRFAAVTGGERHEAELRPTEILEHNQARIVTVLRGRIGASGLVVEATLEVCAGQEHAWFGFGVFFSDPTTKDMERRIELLTVETEGLALFVRHGPPHGVRSRPTRLGSHHVLLERTKLGDGQGIRRVGVLVPPLLGTDDEATALRDATLQAASLCKPLAATDWSDSGAFGIFGHVPKPPPWLQGAALRAAFAHRHAEFVRWSRTTEPQWFRPPRFGLDRGAHRAGEQSDFGVVALEPVAGTGLPSFLYEVEASVLQEGCRPVHFFEADATPVLSAAHPDWVVWDGRTHWHCDVSKDRLGKPCPVPRHETHGWTGKDRQHWSSNYIGAFYLLTAEPQVLLELRNEVQLYLAGQTVREGLSTSGAGVSRGAGRTLLAATWLWLATGDQALLERMRQRMHHAYLPAWAGRDLPADRVRPWMVAKADPRQLPDNADPLWVPWEEALAIVGFAAYLRATRDPDPAVLEMVEELALNNLRHAWRIRDDGRAQVAYAMRFADGRPLTEAERNDPSWTNWPNSGFEVWAIGSVEIARAVAEKRGLEGLAERAERILEHIRARRQRPRDGWYDRLSQWDAVRW